jgi:cytochrome c553
MRRLALVLVLLLTACARQPGRSRMWAHYQRVGAVQSAVVAGDLHIAQAAAYWVARNRLTENLPEHAGPYVESMRTAARAVANAPSLDEAAIATARMGAACGACHTALQRGPHFAAGPNAPPPSDTSVADQMTLHLWVLARMWDGLTGPSDGSWTHGALALNATPRYQSHITRAVRERAIGDSLARRLYVLGQQAVMAGPGDRVVIYGELLGTCARCHQHYRVRLPRTSASG